MVPFTFIPFIHYPILIWLLPPPLHWIYLHWYLQCLQYDQIQWKKLLCSSHFIFLSWLLIWAFVPYWNPLPSELLDPAFLESLLSPFFLFYRLPVVLFLYLDLIYYIPLNKGPSVQFIHSVISDSLWPNGMQHTRSTCSSPTPSINSDSCPRSRWCHPTISSSVIPFSSCLQSFLASGSF